MNDISITEAYFVYSVRGKGKLSGNDCRKVTGLLTSSPLGNDTEWTAHAHR